MRRLVSLINDLLDVARIQAGMVQLDPEPVDVAALLREVHASLMPLAQAKSLAFEPDLPEAAPVLQVDRRALRQILINLSNNAIKFTEHGRVRLELEHSADALRVQVCDTGVGISEADQQKLFFAFTQVGDPRRRSEGTGMGLYLSARFARSCWVRASRCAAPRARAAASRWSSTVRHHCRLRLDAAAGPRWRGQEAPWLWRWAERPRWPRR